MGVPQSQTEHFEEKITVLSLLGFEVQNVQSVA
jgi:hypothetical protein